MKYYLTIRSGGVNLRILPTKRRDYFRNMKEVMEAIYLEIKEQRKFDLSPIVAEVMHDNQYTFYIAN